MPLYLGKGNIKHRTKNVNAKSARANAKDASDISSVA
jgi:hypothetical protein